MFGLYLRAYLHGFISPSPRGGYKHDPASSLVNCKNSSLTLQALLLIFALQPCALCGKGEGAVIRCSDCVKEFHASCAWSHGYKFGFEIQPVSIYSYRWGLYVTDGLKIQVKSSRRDTTAVATFKGETGCMSPIICCRQHDSRRHIYGICETNEIGEVRILKPPVWRAHVHMDTLLCRLLYKCIVMSTNKHL